MIKFLRTNNVKVGMMLGDNVYDPDGNLLIVPKNMTLTDRLVKRLQRLRVAMVPIVVDDVQLAEETQTSHVRPMLDEKLRDEALDGVRRLFAAASTGPGDLNLTTAYQAVRELDGVVDQLVGTLTDEQNAFVRISDLKSYDEYTYHHSLSVAVLSIAIGQQMKLSRKQLHELGRCAMLHDIGKMRIPPEIINKQSRLTDDEFNIIKKHSMFGYEYLVRANIGDETLRRSVLLHHEKVDGTGYPNRVKDTELPVYARIISVADVYDAVTSYRSYRSPMAPSDAMELVMSETGRAFDFTVVRAFLKKLDIYPFNTVLELSDRRQGVVIGNTNSLRPTLRMIDTGDVIDLKDLRNLCLLVTRVIDGRTARAE